ncbi:MAG: hypothetical protein K2Q21_11240 [Chitinophagaceae bacterium]|nr:hypothetical protein [Chitinophagaceae bacterium]
MSDIKNILSKGPEPGEDALKKYLEGTASPEERFAIENQMADEAFMNDAVEGLQNFKSQQLAHDYVKDINKQIQKQTLRKKRRRIRRQIEDQNWTLISILLILVLCVLGYLVIHLSTDSKNKKPVTNIEYKK